MNNLKDIFVNKYSTGAIDANDMAILVKKALQGYLIAQIFIMDEILDLSDNKLNQEQFVNQIKPILKTGDAEDKYMIKPVLQQMYGLYKAALYGFSLLLNKFKGASIDTLARLYEALSEGKINPKTNLELFSSEIGVLQCKFQASIMFKNPDGYLRTMQTIPDNIKEKMQGGINEDCIPYFSFLVPAINHLFDDSLKSREFLKQLPLSILFEGYYWILQDLSNAKTITSELCLVRDEILRKIESATINEANVLLNIFDKTIKTDDPDIDLTNIVENKLVDLAYNGEVNWSSITGLEHCWVDILNVQTDQVDMDKKHILANSLSTSNNPSLKVASLRMLITICNEKIANNSITAEEVDSILSFSSRVLADLRAEHAKDHQNKYDTFVSYSAIRAYITLLHYCVYDLMMTCRRNQILFNNEHNHMFVYCRRFLSNINVGSYFYVENLYEISLLAKCHTIREADYIQDNKPTRKLKSRNKQTYNNIFDPNNGEDMYSAVSIDKIALCFEAALESCDSEVFSVIINTSCLLLQSDYRFATNLLGVAINRVDRNIPARGGSLPQKEINLKSLQTLSSMINLLGPYVENVYINIGHGLSKTNNAPEYLAKYYHYTKQIFNILSTLPDKDLLEYIAVILNCIEAFATAESKFNYADTHDSYVLLKILLSRISGLEPLSFEQKALTEEDAYRVLQALRLILSGNSAKIDGFHLAYNLLPLVKRFGSSQTYQKAKLLVCYPQFASDGDNPYYNNAVIISEFSKILESDPDNIDILAELADRLLSEDSIHLESALELYMKVYGLGDKKVTMQICNILVELAIKEHTDSTVHLKQILELTKGCSEEYLIVRSSAALLLNPDRGGIDNAIAMLFQHADNTNPQITLRKKILEQLSSDDDMPSIPLNLIKELITSEYSSVYDFNRIQEKYRTKLLRRNSSLSAKSIDSAESGAHLRMYNRVQELAAQKIIDDHSLTTVLNRLGALGIVDLSDTKSGFKVTFGSNELYTFHRAHGPDIGKPRRNSQHKSMLSKIAEEMNPKIFEDANRAWAPSL